MQKSASRKSVRAKPSLRKRAKIVGAWIAIGILAPLAFFAVYCLFLFLQVRSTLPSVDEIDRIQHSDATRIYYADNDAKGKPRLMAILAQNNQAPVELRDISKYLIDATIAAEDSRFYEHGGVDLRGIVRAIWHNIRGRDLNAEGASTITQQLARNVTSLGLSREKRLRRKVAEAILAMQIEQRFTKSQILELYLNQIPYGNGAIGAEAAAQAYFKKSAKDLTLGEASFLAGIPNRPSVYSNNLELALRRRDYVLDRMVATGKITPEQRDKAKAQPIRTHRSEVRGTTVFGSRYIVAHVIRRLSNEFDSEWVYDGKSIYTTIDSKIQDLAEAALRQGVRKYGGGSGGPNQGALVCLEPKTGFVRAMVGGLDYSREQFNVVTQGKRQAGSAFKPIVYTAAIDTGKCTLDSTYRDDPDFPWRGRDKWIPKNYSGRYSYRSVTVRSAIAQSLNTIAVKVAVDTGLQTVIDYAKRMGITTIDEVRDRYPTLALGAASVRPIELCSAYSIFANGGSRARPTTILRVVDRDGVTLVENSPEVLDVGLRPETVQAMNEALRGVVTGGTGTAANSVPNACGKTGTTSDNIDAWFAGYTPELATVVWVAHEKRDRSGRLRGYAPMEGRTGGHLCAPIWRDFMLGALQRQREVQAAPASRDVRPPGVSPGTETPPASEEKPARPQTPTDIEGNPISTSPEPPGASPAAGQPTPAPPPAGITGAGTRAAEPSTGAAAPAAAPSRPDPGDEMVRVRLCAESGRRATDWCPATIERTMRRRDVPGPCRLHRPPPGEGN
jgi:penicillin-binding protein 1A